MRPRCAERQRPADSPRSLSIITFVDGRETAHGLAKQVKNNLQASSKDTKQELLHTLVFEKVLSNELVCRATRPKTISYLMFSKYEPGMAYGSHVDNPFQQGLRSDISFTLFLSEADSYDGGELVIETTAWRTADKNPRRSSSFLPFHHPASRKCNHTG